MEAACAGANCAHSLALTEPDLTGLVQALAADCAVAAIAAAPSSDAAAFPTTPAGHGSRVDSLVALPGGRVASKSGDGRGIVWDVATKAQSAVFRVPGCTATTSSRGRLGATPDGAVLLAGGAPGELHAFDSASGTKIATLTTGKVCCGPLCRIFASADAGAAALRFARRFSLALPRTTAAL